jgi:hypothetical protein
VVAWTVASSFDPRHFECPFVGNLSTSQDIEHDWMQHSNQQLRFCGQLRVGQHQTELSTLYVELRQPTLFLNFSLRRFRKIARGKQSDFEILDVIMLGRSNGEMPYYSDGGACVEVVDMQ